LVIVIAATFCFCKFPAKFPAKLTLARTARNFRIAQASGVRKCHQLTTTQWKPKGDHCGDENALKAEHLLNTIDCWIVGCQVDSSVFLARTLELTQKNI
jgi:mRNA-degrading endonuclease toxin of MazEF toxin-antitoxin module